MKINPHKLLSIALSSFLAASFLTAQTTFNWTGDGSNDRFNVATNWNPSGPPASGDTGNVGSNFRVEVGTLDEMNVQAIINMNDNSLLERSSTSQMNVSGTLTFNDSAALVSSNFNLIANSSLVWNSDSTFTSAGSVATANLTTLSGSTTTINNGNWQLIGNTATDSLLLRGGTFNANGGTLVLDNRLRVGQDEATTFNLGTDAEVYADGIFMNVSGSVFNFSIGSTLSLVGNNGINTGGFGTRLSDGFIAIDGVITTDASNFTTQTITGDFGAGELTYTQITAIPEPATSAIIAALGILALSIVLRRRLS